MNPRPLHRRAADPPAAPGICAAAISPAAIGRAATLALHDELALAPKPGLVTLLDAGSHHDMDAHTFMRSLFALRRYFVLIAEAGRAGAGFGVLQQLGLQAEDRMLAATGGINTHRGAIFMLGLLCAAAGALLREAGAPPGAWANAAPTVVPKQSPKQAPRRTSHQAPLAAPVAALTAAPTAAHLREALRRHWGDALAARCQRPSCLPGGIAARRLGLRSASAEAALAFPVLFETALPALRAALARGLTPQQARLDTLFAVMAVLDDSNLAHRGGLAGLRHAQQAARGFLAAGGAARPQGMQAAQAIGADFVARRLSPGGAADTLAAACWLQRWGALGATAATAATGAIGAIGALGAISASGASGASGRSGGQA